MKTCAEPNCMSPVYSHLYCKYHQFRRSMRGGDLYQAKTQAKSRQNSPVEALSLKGDTKIPPASKKRRKEHIRYLEQIKLFWNDAVNDGTNYCFFCGEKMNNRDNVHHWRGRTNDYLLDKRWWVNCHNQCHLDHHHKSIGWLMKQKYYAEFLARLKKFDIESYDKEKKRQEKAQLNFDI